MEKWFGRFDGQSVFKKRCGTGSIGRRRGARIVYYKDDLMLRALSIYVKNGKSNISSKEVIPRLIRN